MERITSLKQLSYNLNLGPGYDGYTQMFKAIELAPEEYRHLCRWDEAKYQRICFYDTDSLEGLITCWKPGQASPIHNYGASLGWIKVLEGQLDLEHYNPAQTGTKPTFHKRFQAGEIGFLNDELGYHRFVNKGSEPAVALFFYSDKITRWKEYDPDSDQYRERQVSSDVNLDAE